MIPDDLRTGDPTIDGQHETLLAEVHVLRLGGDLTSALATLREHFSSHFAAEEALAAAAGYPGFHDHAAEHVRFFDTFTHLRALWQKYPGPDTANALVVALERWMSEHVLGRDVALVTWLRENVVKTSESV